jgi:hypothetical protein
MERYGSDRPDLRFGLELSDWTEATADIDFGVIRGAVEGRARARARSSRRATPVTQADRRSRGGGQGRRRAGPSLGQAERRTGSPARWDGSSPPSTRRADGPRGRRPRLRGGGPRRGDVARARGHAGRRRPRLELPHDREDAWLWVTGFPVFEEDGRGGLRRHHPFVMPHADDLELLESDPVAVRGTAYDLVYNGTEFGSGSIRIHDPALQRRVLKDPRPHGRGDRREVRVPAGRARRRARRRMVALPWAWTVSFSGSRRSESLRDVIAFPKTTAARALYEGAPTSGRCRELEELGLIIASDTRTRGADRSREMGWRTGDHDRAPARCRGRRPAHAGGGERPQSAGVSRLFGVRTVLRGDHVILSGALAAVERSVPVLQHMIELARLRAPVRHVGHRALRRRHRRARRGGDRHPTTRSVSRSRARGASSCRSPTASARTSASIVENDIVIGIGPAGTGKTYLAVACAVDALYKKRVRASCWPAPRSRPERTWASSPVTCRRRSTRTCVRSTTRSRT